VKVGKPGHQTEKLVQFFGWEKLDAVESVRKAFGL
jgi:S-adenosylmethionine synthetase